MLSYRHAFHAGNHADVLKHFVLVELIHYLNRKDKPYLFVDTHAGAGRYALDSEQARKNGEFRGGIGRLWTRTDLPAPLDRYLQAVRDFNREKRLRFYPGSPALAAALTRGCDRLRLFELHPTDFGFLQKAFPATDKRIVAAREDGFAALKVLLPPPERRALVLVDPPYELRGDYRTLCETISGAMRRFAGGTYMLWYPRLQQTDSKRLVDRLARLEAPTWLNVWLDVARPSRDGFGMHGSGLYIVNPPWTLPEVLAEAMPLLCAALAVDDGARFGLEHHIP